MRVPRTTATPQLSKRSPDTAGSPGFNGSLLIAGAILLAAAAALYRFPPTADRFYPRCPVHELTGLLCPGCGATHALAALLHGHAGEAFRENALFVCLLPAAAMYIAACVRRREWITLPKSVLGSVLMITAVFTIMRNVS
jgi:hypothetical protein